VKAVAVEAVHPKGTVVLNAGDPKLVALAATLAPEVVFFADLDANPAPATREAIARHRAAGHRVVVAEGGVVRHQHGSSSVDLIDVDAVPVTFGGAARHNVENALGVVAMARALGFDDDAIVTGLRAFSNDDNPGRGNVIERGDVRIMLDFGHNPEGIRSVLHLVASLRKGRGRLIVVAGSAGDRSDQEIGEMSRAIAAAKADRVLLRDLGGYLRGRLPGDVPRILERALVGYGFPKENIVTVDSEVEALRRARADAQPGDFVLVLVHLDRAEVQAFLADWG
jgi:UDP-N-acetylmuramyl tripeptide synthase